VGGRARTDRRCTRRSAGLSEGAPRYTTEVQCRKAYIMQGSGFVKGNLFVITRQKTSFRLPITMHASITRDSISRVQGMASRTASF
jgi:hypothetical protein